MGIRHINAQQLWEYINYKGELSSDQHEHLAACAHCLELFRRCVLSEKPEGVEDVEEPNQRSA
jgi:hypothetical protein